MSKRTTKYLIIAGLLAALGLLLVACQGATQVTAPTQGPAPTQAAVPTCPAPAACPTAVPVEEGVVAPFEAEWAASPHNALESEAFAHWNEEDPAEIPANCAACHSTPGYIDFLGGDGTEAGTVDANVAVGTTVNCDACHSPAAAALTAVTFPSGAVVDDLGPEARCMVCHQGRASSTQVNAQIERFQAEDPDRAPLPLQDGERTVNFGFINIHYYAAAATLYGTEAKGAYEYAGKTYDAKFDHIDGYDTCVDCHNPHTTEVKMDECAVCHDGASTVEDLRAIRMLSSARDYDGDGNMEEGMADEIAGLSDTLYGAIIMYAKDLQGTGIVYDSSAHPYWFNDRDNNGEADTNDEGRAAAYNTWTPRLLKAAYNYQVALKDPGNYAHGNKYTIQYLYDAIEDLNVALPTKLDMSTMVRDDAGHFAGNSEAFRHWDAEGGEVPSSCAKCHSATGLPMFVENGGTHVIAGNGSLMTTGVVNVDASNGFTCYTCHNHNEWPAVYQINEVVFPSGARASFGEGDPNNLCLQCHQGRESSVSMNRALGDRPGDTVDESVRFRNVHYFVAGATLFGTEVKGVYEWAGKTYSGRFEHVPNFDSCSECHDAHALEVEAQSCAGCHQGQALDQIRMNTDDVDGDAAEEGVKGEIDTYIEKLYAAIQAYASENSVGIVYDSHAYPYWFADANGDGAADTGENGAVGYAAWTPNLVRAAYNYQYAQKDPGAFAHNPSYVIQALYDSIEAIGGDMTGLVRPEVTTPAP